MSYATNALNPVGAREGAGKNGDKYSNWEYFPKPLVGNYYLVLRRVYLLIGEKVRVIAAIIAGKDY